MRKLLTSRLFLPLCICLLFFVAYASMGVVRHMHFLTGYDLADVDQAIWKYSRFEKPITTNLTYAFTPILWDHVELIYPLLVPFYWIANTVYTLILLQAFGICSSGVAVWLLCKKYKLSDFNTFALLISYLSFYGIQNAIWADVHSLVFGVTFLVWFLYFIEIKKWKTASVFFILTIICKEDMALLTLLISSVLFYFRRDKQLLWYIGWSIAYLFFIYEIYFPHFVPGGYRFQSKDGLLSHINATNFWNTPNKRNVLLYSSLWYGLLPFLSPLYLLPAIGDLIKYFVVANSVVTSGQSMFGHYRSSLSILLLWPTIFTISRLKFLQTKYTGLYILLCTLILQYLLHLPLSYLTKRWFWTTPPSVVYMKQGIQSIPKNASVVTQVNFLPQMSHREEEFVLWPETKNFPTETSPCGKPTCNWIRWAGSPQYMLTDISNNWDIRYWLTTRENFMDAINNLQKAGVIHPLKSWQTTTLYKVMVKQNI